MMKDDERTAYYMRMMLHSLFNCWEQQVCLQRKERMKAGSLLSYFMKAVDESQTEAPLIFLLSGFQLQLEMRWHVERLIPAYDYVSRFLDRCAMLELEDRRLPARLDVQLDQQGRFERFLPDPEEKNHQQTQINPN